MLTLPFPCQAGSFESVMGQLREKAGVKMKRPAAASTKPAAAPSEANSKIDSNPKPKATKAIPMKKPGAKAKGNVKKPELKKPPNALKLYPHGCGKCRYKPGCTPSCFKYRKEWR